MSTRGKLNKCGWGGGMVFNATLYNIEGLNKYILYKLKKCILKVSVDTVFCSDTVTAEHIVMLWTQFTVICGYNNFLDPFYFRLLSSFTISCVNYMS